MTTQEQPDVSDDAASVEHSLKLLKARKAYADWAEETSREGFTEPPNACHLRHALAAVDVLLAERNRLTAQLVAHHDVRDEGRRSGLKAAADYLDQRSKVESILEGKGLPCLASLKLRDCARHLNAQSRLADLTETASGDQGG